ncbi:glyoxalase [Peribacillus cavernae]|uniref:Glyoxalase n=1 Tax=Peribacillus cavernae TaxID=1674310 RepID=A0A3S0U934_9BACI|nr:VOC family protein [Peribacillus cavernae]MDQ0218040.1 hypothetical protein [Peribacillus cavernae]RUQ32795.1 glyoxalase [Peribacillus cavernae]
MFGKTLQIGLVVDDVEAYMKKYNDVYGIGPWTVYDFNKDNISNMTVHGKKEEYTFKVAICFEFHNMQWELIEPTSDNSIYSEFLKEHGPGLHHIALSTENADSKENYEDVMLKMAARGINEIQGGEFALKYTYLDTMKDLGFILEIFNTNEDYDLPASVGTYPSQK